MRPIVILKQIPLQIIKTMSSNVPAAINEVGIPFLLPYPFSINLIKHGTNTDGLMHAMVNPSKNATTHGIPNKYLAITAATVASMP
jgi:hypothetical protein